MNFRRAWPGGAAWIGMLAGIAHGDCPVQLLSSISLGDSTAVRAVRVAGDVAYVFGHEQTYSINIRDVTSPTIIAQSPTFGQFVHDSVYGQGWVFTAGKGIRAFDVSTPGNLTGPVVYEDGETKSGIALDGLRAYITSHDGAGGSLAVLDISDPLSPRLLGRSAMPPYNGYLQIGVLSPGLVAVTVTTNNGYAVLVLDLTDPSSPRLVSTPYTASHPSTTIGELRIADRRLFIGTETYSTPEVIAFDLSDPAKPFMTDWYQPGLIGLGRVGAGPRIVIAPTTKEDHFLRVTAEGKFELKHIHHAPYPPASLPRIDIRGDHVFLGRRDKLFVFLAGECQADCDCSGHADINDFVCFQTLFATSDPAADCDGDGALMIDDFVCFQSVFAAGC